MEEMHFREDQDIYRLAIGLYKFLLSFVYFTLFIIQGMYVCYDEFKSRFQILDAIYGDG